MSTIENNKILKSHYKSPLSALSRELTRNGFMDYRATKYFSNSLNEVLDEAGDRMEAGDFLSAISAASAVLEEGVKAINRCDDSSGYIGESISQAIDLLKEMSESSMDKKSRKSLFDYCTKSFSKELFMNWDWHLMLLETALNAATTTKEFQLIDTLIEAEIHAKDRSWHKEAAMELKVKLITKTISKEAAITYMSKHLNTEVFREHLIKHNLEINNLTQAKKLAQEGLERGKNEKVWREYLVTIAEKEDNKEEVIAQAKILLLTTDRLEQMQSNITILRSWFNFIEWIEFKLLLKDELGAQSKMSNLLFLLAELEEDWELYLEQLGKAKCCGLIEDAEEKLPQSYYPALAQLYYDAIVNDMSYQIGRNHYQRAAQYIKHIIKLGQRDIANKLTLYLRATYPKRRALMEELDTI